MKLHILNDLHIEFEDFAPPVTDADVVILAGDIGLGIGGLHWADARFPNRPVIYVPGNHELYHYDLVLIEELKTQAPDHIHVLNDDQVIIDGVRFWAASSGPTSPCSVRQTSSLPCSRRGSR